MAGQYGQDAATAALDVLALQLALDALRHCELRRIMTHESDIRRLQGLLKYRALGCRCEMYGRMTIEEARRSEYSCRPLRHRKQPAQRHITPG